MELTNCPMCQSALATDSGATVKSCDRCGADLSGWLPKNLPPPRSTISEPTRAAGGFNLGLGISGAVAGALIGAGLMYGFDVMAGFRFPLLGVGIGALTGYGARLLAKGTDNTLGIISAVLSAAAVAGTLFLMYGEFPPICIISVIVSVSVAYRIAAR